MNHNGVAAEELALQFLRSKGLRLLARNYSCRLGEIDLILDHAGVLVFVEVRQRRSTAFGGAAHSITARKRARLIATAHHYLASRSPYPPCRFDAVLLDGEDRVQWIRDAFGA
jgi:putative endonuclease